MTSIVKLTALSGVDGESPPCYLLHVDEFRFLLDCGWDENSGTDLLKNLKRHVSHLDAVLLSYPDTFHLGALPHLVGKMGLRCPIYATIPVLRMGQLFMYDLHQSKHSNEDFDLFSLDDVDLAFEKIRQLSYNQSIDVKGRIGTTLQITALPAGHMIGGTIWKIVKDGNEVIVYGVDYNHRKERHLNGCSFENIFRPHLFITDSCSLEHSQSKRVSMDEQLFATVLKTLRNDGNVLVAVDTAGRVLEIAYLLEQMWRNQDTGLMAYNLVMLNHVSYNVIEFAKSLVEWMSDKVRKPMESQRTNPFQFKCLQICHSLSELSQVPEPKVVLVSMPDLESGFSRELFIQWCGNPNNSIILTHRTSPGTLARKLIDEPDCKAVTLEVKRKIRLEGIELDEFKRKVKQQKVEKVKPEELKKFEDDGDSSSGSDLDDWEDAAKVFRQSFDYIVKAQVKRKGCCILKPAKKTCFMFPFKETRTKHDEYGAAFDPKMFFKCEGPSHDEKKQKTSDLSVSEEKEEIPAKCTSTTETLDILAQILFIDFEGRSDGEFLKNVVSQIKPLQVIMVKGQESFLEKFIESAKIQMPKDGRILIPKLNEPLDATMDNHVLQVKLTDALLSSLHFQKVKDYELAWMDAKVILDKPKPDTSDAATCEEEEEDDTIPTLDNLQHERVKPHNYVFVNNLRLSEFKEVLVKHGFRVEFCGGVLVCNGRIAIKKNESGQLIPEGAICEEFDTILDLINQQFVVL